MDIYVYQGGLYCPSCAASIMKGLGRHQDSGDSGDYPQGPVMGGGESDTPEHCSGCHEFLKIGLTEEGRQYVRDALREFVFHDQGRKEVLEQWSDYYDIPWPDGQDTNLARQLGKECANEALAMAGYPRNEEDLPGDPKQGDWACLEDSITGRGPTDSERVEFERAYWSVIKNHREYEIE